MGQRDLTNRPWVVHNLGEGYSYQPGDRSSTPVAGSGGGIPDVVVAAEDTLYIDSADLRSQDFISDEEMLQEAIALLDEDGGWIHLLAGTYIFSGPILLAGKTVRLTGAGPGSTIIKVAAGATISGVIDFGINTLDSGEKTYTIEDLTIDGAKATGATVSDGLILSHGGGVANTSTSATIYLNRLVLKNSSSRGIRGLRDVSVWHLRSVTATNCGTDGFFFQESRVYGHVVRSVGNDGVGYRAAYSGPHLLTACEFSGNAGKGIDNGGIFGSAPEFILLNSIVADNGGEGIDAHHADIGLPGIFVGNRISGNGGRSIHADAASVVMGNRIFGNGIDTPIPNTGGNVIGGVAQTPLVPQTIPFSRVGDLAVLTGTQKWVAFRAGQIIQVRAAVGTAPTGNDLRVNVRKNGIATGVFALTADQPTIAAGSTIGTAKAPTATPTFVAGDYLTVDIDAVGSIVAGADLTVEIEVHYTEGL